MLATFAALACLVQSAPAVLDRDAAYALAVRERLAGQFDAAITGLKALIADYPDDVDARLQLGLALKAAGRSRESELALQDVLRQAPEYRDARIALAELALDRGDAPTARTLLGTLLTQPELDPDIDRLAHRLETPSPATAAKWRVDAVAAYSELTKNLPAWQEASLSLSHPIAPQSALTGRVETLDRFHLHETYLEGEFDHGWSGGEWSVALGGSLNPIFRAEESVKGSILLIPWRNSPYRLNFDANYSRYVAGNVGTVRVGGDRLFLHDRGDVGLRVIDTIDENDKNLLGFSTSFSWQFAERFRASTSFVDAAETDEGATTRVRAVGIAGAISINDRVSIQPSLSEEMRENSYDRLEAAVGVTARF